MKNMVRDDCIAFIGDAAHPTAGAYGMGSAFAFGDVLALYRSLHRAHASRPPTIATQSRYSGQSDRSTPPCTPRPAGSAPSMDTYNIPYALHLYNETRRHFLQRVERQLGYDKLDVAYCMEVIDDYDEYVKRYRETFTVNFWLLEHDVDARWQEVEAEARYTYPLAPRSIAQPYLKGS
jgi:salicylate hydroxylase